jgi:site-specific DNA-methyltransferase (cytosine-N4-specific)
MIQKWDSVFDKQGAWDWDKQITLIDLVMEECVRVLIPGGILCLNIGDSTRTINKEFCCYPNYAALTMKLYLGLGMTPLIPIFWKKISNRPNAFLGSGFQPVNAYVSQDCEFIGIFRKGKNRTFTGEEKERRKKSSFSRDERDHWFSQIWEGVPGKKGAKEDSGWNMEIPFRLMRMYSIIGDIVLDPFCGKIGGVEFEKMCNQWGRQFIGFTLP